MQVLVAENQLQVEEAGQREGKLKKAKEDAVGAAKSLEADYTAKFNTQRAKLQVREQHWSSHA